MNQDNLETSNLRKLRSLLSLKRAAALLILALIIFWALPKERRDAAAGAGQTQGPLDVRVTTVQPETVPVVLEYLGQTEAFQKVEIRARVQAFLDRRLFEEGGNVTEGDVLFLLERSSFEAELEAANATLAQMQARDDQAVREVERMKLLVTSNAAAKRELEDWQTREAMARADINTAKARIRQAELNLEYTTIKSPLTGTVGKAFKDVGSYLNPQADSLLAVVQQIDPIYVQFPVTERDILRWRDFALSAGGANVSVEVTLADGKRYPRPGKIRFTDVRIEPGTGTAQIRANLPNPEGLLRPGQLVRVKVLGLLRENALTVPQQAVIHAPTGALVYVISDKQTVEPRPLVLGDWVKDRWIVDEGLKPGERVALDRLMQLRPGFPVQPIETEAAAGPAAKP